MKKTYSFTLVLSGFDKLTEQVEDALYGKKCDDALLSIRSGVPYLDFDREAPSFQEAVLSALRDVERALPYVSVLRVEPDDLVTASEIGRRVNRTRESVRLLVRGARGPGGFPPPASSLTQKSPIWRWVEVVNWFVAQNMVAAEVAKAARTVAAINAALELRRHDEFKDALKELAYTRRGAPTRAASEERADG